MKTYLVCLLSVSLLFFLYDCQDLQINPFPIAEVNIGDNLTLTCIYTGNNTPVLVRWFIGNDTTGMLVSKTTCNIIGTPGTEYEVARYAINCSQLTIKNITKNDNGDVWGCTVAFTFGSSPPVNSTEIRAAVPTPPPAITTTTMATTTTTATTRLNITLALSSTQTISTMTSSNTQTVSTRNSSVSTSNSSDTHTFPVIPVVIGVAVFILIIIIIITCRCCYLYRDRKEKHTKQQHESELEVTKNPTIPEDGTPNPAYQLHQF